MTSTHDSLSLDELRQVEAACVRFEAAWQAGQQPCIEDYLAGTAESVRREVVRRELLRELLGLELAYRQKLGETPTVQQYVHRFPDVENVVFMRQTAAAPTPAELRARISPALPQRVGRYRLQEEIDRGGMGQIVRVIDEAFDRALAMKVMLVDDRTSVADETRFLREARLTGQLQHPGIPPVQDLGRLADGRPYFVMKLVRGKSLAELLEGGVDTNDLPRFVAIFEQVCQTLAYTHAHGIIHRDLKPGNIMVGAFGEVQVLDWGLAKQLNDPNPGDLEAPSSAPSGPDSTTLPSPATPGSMLIGTPGYMAPEQARGKANTLDARCDVFGVGGVLCAILTGKPPFAASSQIENRRLAMQGDLADAFARLDACGADPELTDLAKRCLAPQPADRPQHAGVVAEIAAQYQAALQQRMRQAEIDRAAALVQAQEEQKRRAVEQARADEERKRREAEQAKTREERKRHRTSLGLAAAVGVLLVGASLAGLWYQAEMARQRAEKTRQELALAQERAYVNHAVAAAVGDAEQRRLQILQRLADQRGVNDWLSDLDHWHAAIAQARAALQPAEVLAAGKPDFVDANLVERLRTLAAGLQADENNWRFAHECDAARAKAAYLIEGHWHPQWAASRYPGIFADFGLDILKGDLVHVIAQLQASPLRLVYLANLDHWALVTPSQAERRRLFAVANALDAHPWRRQIRNAEVWNEPDKVQHLAKSVNFQEHSPHILAATAHRLGDTRGPGAAWLRSALLYHPRDFWLHFDLGTLATDPASAAGYFRSALALRPNSAVAHNDLGHALAEEKQFDEAAKHFRKAIELEPAAVIAQHNLGLTLFASGDTAGAIEQYRQALKLDAGNADICSSLGVALATKHEPKPAIAQFRLALKSDPRHLLAHYNLGNALRGQGDLDGAIEQFRQTIEIDPRHGWAHNGLGVALRQKAVGRGKDQGELAEAIQHFRRAIKINDKHTTAHLNLGMALYQVHDVDGAIQHYRRTLELDPKNAPAHRNLGIALVDKRQQCKQAIQHFQAALQLVPDDATTVYNLGVAQLKDGNVPAAIAQFRAALKIQPTYVDAQDRLSSALLVGGQFAEARAEMRALLTRLPPQHPLRPARQQQLQHCEHLLGLEQRLPAVLQGDGYPDKPAQLLEFATLCQRYKQAYRTATRFYADLLRLAPQLAADVANPTQYNAARCAALAAAGAGRAGVGDNAEESARLRRLAYAWLDADLGLWRKHLEVGGVPAVLALESALSDRQRNPDLTSVRDTNQLAGLAPTERAQWQALWTEVYRLLLEAQSRYVATEEMGSLTADHRERLHQVKMVAGTTYVIELKSRQFDAYLRLQNAEGEVLDENNDISPQNQDARLIFTPTRDGLYSISATSFEHSGTGSYTLSLRAFTKAPLTKQSQ